MLEMNIQRGRRPNTNLVDQNLARAIREALACGSTLLK